MINKKETKQLMRYLKNRVRNIKKFNGNMTTASWGYEEGVLLTGNEAIAVIELLQKSIDDNNANKN